MPTETSPRPYKVTEDGKILASTTTFHKAQCAVARRIGADVEGRVLIITGPKGRTRCTNNGLTIRYIELAPTVEEQEQRIAAKPGKTVEQVRELISASAREGGGLRWA